MTLITINHWNYFSECKQTVILFAMSRSFLLIYWSIFLLVVSMLSIPQMFASLASVPSRCYYLLPLCWLLCGLPLGCCPDLHLYKSDCRSPMVTKIYSVKIIAIKPHALTFCLSDAAAPSIRYSKGRGGITVAASVPVACKQSGGRADDVSIAIFIVLDMKRCY